MVHSHEPSIVIICILAIEFSIMPDYEIQFGKASLGNLKQNLDVGTMMFYAKPRVNLPKNLVVAMCSREISLDDHPINLKRHLLDNDLPYSSKIRWK